MLLYQLLDFRLSTEGDEVFKYKDPLVFRTAPFPTNNFLLIAFHKASFWGDGIYISVRELYPCMFAIPQTFSWSVRFDCAV